MANLGQSATTSYLSSKLKSPDFSKAREYMNNAYQDTKTSLNNMKDSVTNNEYLNNAYQNTRSKFNNMKDRLNTSLSNYRNSMGGKIRTRRHKKHSSKHRRKNNTRRNRRKR